MICSVDVSIPTELRRAIIRVRKQGFTYEQTATMLGVGRATVNRILRLERESGDVERRPRGGGVTSPIHGKLAKLLESIVTDMPDATVVELTNALVDRAGIATSRSSVQRALGRLGFSRKKSPSWQRSATRQSTEKDAASTARS